jgi:hypothetical protein
MSVQEIDDNTLYAVATKLNQLTQQYTGGQLKHMNYVDQYDKTLELYRITKKDLAHALAKRNASRLEDLKVPAVQAKPVKKPLY